MYMYIHIYVYNTCIIHILCNTPYTILYYTAAEASPTARATGLFHAPQRAARINW